MDSPPSVNAVHPMRPRLRKQAVFRTSRGVLYQGDARVVLHELPRESVDCIIGSPPYFSVRDYQVQGQIGLERTVNEYLDAISSVYDSAKPVLKETGSC